VVLIEKDKVGGTCLHRGCIPTKALLHAGEIADQARESSFFGVNATFEGIDMGGVHKYKDGVISKNHKGLTGLIKSRGIQIVEGEGRLVGPKTVQVARVDGSSDTYTGANVVLAKHGAKHRKRSGNQQPSDAESGVAIVLGALLDGIPESVVIGVSLLDCGTVSMAAVIAIFLSNVPEGLSGTAGMKNAGRSALYIFGLWGGIAVASGIAALLGYVLIGGLGPAVVAATDAVAAGAILSMIADTMIPEAFEATHDYAGLVTVVGFLIAFSLSQLGGQDRAPPSDAAPSGQPAAAGRAAH
jgi:ZIP family zinc transporter